MIRMMIIRPVLSDGPENCDVGEPIGRVLFELDDRMLIPLADNLEKYAIEVEVP